MVCFSSVFEGTVVREGLMAGREVAGHSVTTQREVDAGHTVMTPKREVDAGVELSYCCTLQDPSSWDGANYI